MATTTGLLPRPKPTDGGARGFRIDRQRYRSQESAGVRAVFEPGQAHHGGAAMLCLENAVFALKRAMYIEALGVWREPRNLFGDIFGEE